MTHLTPRPTAPHSPNHSHTHTHQFYSTLAEQYSSLFIYSQLLTGLNSADICSIKLLREAHLFLIWLCQYKKKEKKRKK